MPKLNQNAEGYADPTAYEALKPIIQSETDLVSEYAAEVIAQLQKEIASLRNDNEQIRQNNVSGEAVRIMLDEHNLTVEQLKSEIERYKTGNLPCRCLKTRVYENTKV